MKKSVKRRQGKNGCKEKVKGSAMQKLCVAGLGLVLGIGIVAVAAPALALTPAGEVISNQAQVDYKDANGNALPTKYSNTVTTTVSQVAGVDVSPDLAAKNAVKNTSAWYGASITNTGNGTDIFDLDLTGVPSDWTVTIYLDTNEDGIWDPSETTVVSDTGALLAGYYNFHVIVVVDVPDTAADHDIHTLTLTATSQFNPAVSNSGVYATTVQSSSMGLEKFVDPTSDPQPGDTLTYAIRITMTGTAPASDVTVVDYIPTNTTYVTGSIRGGTWGVSYANATPKTDADDGDEANYNISNPGAVTGICPYLAPGEDKVFYFQVIVNSKVPAETHIHNSARGNYYVGGVLQPQIESNDTDSHVAQLPGVLLDPDRTGFADPGDELVYAFTAANTGNTPDIIDLPYTSTAGWSWVIWVDQDGDGVPGTGGDYILTDTNGNGIIDTGVLVQNQSLNLLAVTTIPAGLADETIDVTTITGTSAADSSVTDPEVLTTTVTAPVITIAKSVSPVGNQPPGTVSTYTIVITNNGAGVATNVVITDVIPTNTTYVPGSMLVNGVSKTDDHDGDGAQFTGSAVLVGSGAHTYSLGQSGTLTLQFSVTID